MIGIEHIEYFLPGRKLTNLELKKDFPSMDISKIVQKSGVESRNIAEEKETAYDLAVNAIEKLVSLNQFDLNSIDGIIFCTQSPDFIMPSNAFLIHKKFDLKHNVWAFDINLACSGYVYGISIARGMIESGMGSRVLLINADTYSKHIHLKDRSTRILFGDGAAVTVLAKNCNNYIQDINLASSGKDYESFYIPAGGARMPYSELTSKEIRDFNGNVKTLENINMNGFAVWKFVSKIVPNQIKEILSKNNLRDENIDLYVFHQASKLTLDSLIKSLKIDPNKVFFNIEKIGNTVSASIPIALKDAMEEKRINKNQTVLVSGFGVGLSWGSLVIKF